MKSAFDDEDGYELTQLGQQFVHYAMTDLPVKLNFQPAADAEEMPLSESGAPDHSNAETAAPAT